MSDFIHNEMPDDDLLAAEFVLGVLTADERRVFERRIAREPAFAAMVGAWENRLLPWTNAIAPVTPPAAVWDRIDATLPERKAARAAGASMNPGNAVSWWRGLSFGAGGLALASIAALFLVLQTPNQPPLVAALEGGGQRAFVATVDVGRTRVIVMPAGYSAATNVVPELWLIAPNTKPRSLGLLSAERAVIIAMPPGVEPRADYVLAVSLEPPGGSTTGAPTGPVIAQGKLTAL